MARREPADPAQQAKQTAVRKSLQAIEEAVAAVDDIEPHLHRLQVRKALAEGRVPAVPPPWWAEAVAAEESGTA